MFTLLHGKFVVRNPQQPDGDTIRFKPDNVAAVDKLRRGSRGSPIMDKGVNIRLEAVDALEKAQELTGATAARDELLCRLGFIDVTYSGNPPFVINSSEQEVSGHVLSNGFDNFRRLIGFVFEGDGSGRGSDGSVISLDKSLVDESVNTALLSEGYVFPAFYDTLPESLRQHLVIKSTAARKAKKGVWSRSKGFPGDPLILETPTLANLRKAVLWPKLYRRLEKFLESGGRKDLDGFDDWLQQDPSRDDGILLIQSNPPKLVRLHNVVEVSGSSIELKFWPEEFVIQGHPTNPNPNGS
ncbi:glr2961-like protein [Beauveria brongniartii RCEF 3172]|uniref:Glr2961-like protein n=1 Tax=Beauveria brongniartii RCEF 3172 TaxID=1081107 RepID=A0A167AZ73_9HYPO|nr:glr2961-like protein [Beauveria brongniartii RCEF 3172]